MIGGGFSGGVNNRVAWQIYRRNVNGVWIDVPNYNRPLYNDCRLLYYDNGRYYENDPFLGGNVLVGGGFGSVRVGAGCRSVGVNANVVGGCGSVGVNVNVGGGCGSVSANA